MRRAQKIRCDYFIFGPKTISTAPDDQQYSRNYRR
jgi:hypothetical protein